MMDALRKIQLIASFMSRHFLILILRQLQRRALTTTGPWRDHRRAQGGGGRGCRAAGPQNEI